ncbi:hypothetical protein J6590_083403 [Homalodisca vitripennis]|nr:hypothetical protein J6590_083403 [Homalodisca vitripennis]
MFAARVMSELEDMISSMYRCMVKSLQGNSDANVLQTLAGRTGDYDCFCQDKRDQDKSSSYESKYFHRLMKSSSTVHVADPTRETATTRTLIDHIIRVRASQLERCGVILMIQ